MGRVITDYMIMEEGGKEGEKGGAKGGKGEKGGGGLHVECFGVKRIVRRSTIPRGYCSTT